MIEVEKRNYYEGFVLAKTSRWLKRQLYEGFDFKEKEYGDLDKAFIRFGELLDLGQKFAFEEDMVLLEAELRYLMRVCIRREVSFRGGLKAVPEKLGFHEIWDDVCYRRYNLGQRWAGAGVHGAWMLFAERIRMEHIHDFILPKADPYDSFMILSLLEYEAGSRTKDFEKNPFMYFISLTETILDLERCAQYRIQGSDERGILISSDEKSDNMEEIYKEMFKDYGLHMTKNDPGTIDLALEPRLIMAKNKGRKGMNHNLAAETSGYA